MIPSSKLCWPTPDGRPPRAVVAVLAVVLGVLAVSAPLVEVDALRLLRSLGGMAEFAWHLVVVPEWGYLPELLGKVLETMQIAFLGTALATVVSLPVGLLAARNTTPHPALASALRSVLSATRAFPDLMWALVFVSALGLGPLPGVMALAVVTVGFMGKFFAEAFEVVDDKAVEGLQAHGAGWLQVRSFAHLPQALPDLVGTLMYVLDHNFRAATILGVVGAGGIGYDLVMAVRLYDFPRLVLILVVVLAVVSALDRFSNHLRRSIA